MATPTNPLSPQKTTHKPSPFRLYVVKTQGSGFKPFEVGTLAT